ncbi:unnamed protein product [Pleuronectes platessa]|uniref:Uncharacterized protein n=1 Tax=Pleuronectes platessa TaxID=8262 RepID=A0A9N7TWJ0_PLEPL|nr:unnamed protein product [Pleuronectes platessa]
MKALVGGTSAGRKRRAAPKPPDLRALPTMHFSRDTSLLSNTYSNNLQAAVCSLVRNSRFWHCMTPAAFECSFKACLAECFSPHVLALSTNPPASSSFYCSSSSSSPPALRVFPVHFCPCVLSTSLCPLFCCTPCPLTAPACRAEIENSSTLTSARTAAPEINGVNGEGQKYGGKGSSMAYSVSAGDGSIGLSQSCLSFIRI